MLTYSMTINIMLNFGYLDLMILFIICIKQTTFALVERHASGKCYKHVPVCQNGYLETTLTSRHKHLLHGQTTAICSKQVNQLIDSRGIIYHDGTTLSISLYLEDTDETEGIYEMRVVVQNVQQLKIEAAKYEKRNESILETVHFNPHDGDATDEWSVAERFTHFVGDINVTFSRRNDEKPIRITSLRLLACLKSVCYSNTHSCSQSCQTGLLNSKRISYFWAVTGQNVTDARLLHLLDGRNPFIVPPGNNSPLLQIQLNNQGAAGERIFQIEMSVKNARKLMIRAKNEVSPIQACETESLVNSNSSDDWNIIYKFSPPAWAFDMTLHTWDTNRQMEITSMRVFACFRKDVCPAGSFHHMLNSDVDDQFSICVNDKGHCNKDNAESLLALMNDVTGSLFPPRFIMAEQLDFRINIDWKRIDGRLLGFKLLIQGASTFYVSADFVYTYAEIIQYTRPHDVGPRDDWYIHQEFNPMIRDYAIVIKAEVPYPIIIKQFTTSSCLHTFPCCSLTKKVQLDYVHGPRFFTLYSNVHSPDPWLACHFAPGPGWVTSNGAVVFNITAEEKFDIKQICFTTKHVCELGIEFYMAKTYKPNFFDQFIIKAKGWQTTCIDKYTDVTSITASIYRCRGAEAMYVKDMRIRGCRK